jgi:hypothetical protein
MHTGSMVEWFSFVVAVGNLIVLTVTAVFVYQYLRETERIRVANEAQLEAQIRPEVESAASGRNSGIAARVDCARIDTATHGQGHFKKGARKHQAEPKPLKSPFACRTSSSSGISLELRSYFPAQNAAL